MHSISNECNSEISHFLSALLLPTHRVITPLITHNQTHSHRYLDFGGERKRRSGSLTDVTIPGNRVESGRRSRYVDIWVDVMKNRTFSLQSCVTPQTLKPCLPVSGRFPTETMYKLKCLLTKHTHTQT